jgi:sugar/nucleoside kinase (ribokinase family)
MTAPQGNPTVLMFGEVNPDIVVTAVPHLSFGQREDLTGPTTMTVGSSVAIAACGLARLGTTTGLVGVIGDDAFGAFMVQRLRDRQVLVDRVRTVAGGRTGSSVILVRRGDNNDRHILTDRGVMEDLRAGDLDLQQAAGVRHVHVGSWFLQTGAVAELPATLAEARKRGMSTSIDPNDDPAREWDSQLPEGLRHADFFFCNESEAMGVARSLGDGEPATAHEAAGRILSHLPPEGVVILKCGHRGAYALHARATLHVAAPAVTVQDTVGAGDTLAAAFLHAHLQGWDLAAALRLAVAAGSLSTRLPGGVDGQPTSAEASELAATLTATTVPAGRVVAAPSAPPTDPSQKMRTPL